jgi:hypothetical protein
MIMFMLIMVSMLYLLAKSPGPGSGLILWMMLKAPVKLNLLAKGKAGTLIVIMQELGIFS